MNKDSAQCIFSGSADWRKFCGHYESMMELFHKMIWDRHSQLGGISGELLRSHFCLILYVQVFNFVDWTNRVHCVQKAGPNLEVVDITLNFSFCKGLSIFGPESY